MGKMIAQEGFASGGATLRFLVFAADGRSFLGGQSSDKFQCETDVIDALAIAGDWHQIVLAVACGQRLQALRLLYGSRVCTPVIGLIQLAETGAENGEIISPEAIEIFGREIKGKFFGGFL